MLWGGVDCDDDVTGLAFCANDTLPLVSRKLDRVTSADDTVDVEMIAFKLLFVNVILLLGWPSSQ